MFPIRGWYRPSAFRHVAIILHAHGRLIGAHLALDPLLMQLLPNLRTDRAEPAVQSVNSNVAIAASTASSYCSRGTSRSQFRETHSTCCRFAGRNRRNKRCPSRIQTEKLGDVRRDEHVRQAWSLP